MITPDATVIVRVEMVCPDCKRSLRVSLDVPKVLLATNMTDTVILRKIREATDDVETQARKRGWEDVCGQCRDPDHKPKTDADPKPHDD